MGTKMKGSRGLMRNDEAKVECRFTIDGAWYEANIHQAKVESRTNAEPVLLVPYENGGETYNSDDIEEIHLSELQEKLRLVSSCIEDKDCSKVKCGTDVLALVKKDGDAKYYDGTVVEIYHTTHGIGDDDCKCTFMVKFDPVPGNPGPYPGQKGLWAPPSDILPLRLGNLCFRGADASGHRLFIMWERKLRRLAKEFANSNKETHQRVNVGQCESRAMPNSHIRDIGSKASLESEEQKSSRAAKDDGVLSARTSQDEKLGDVDQRRGNKVGSFDKRESIRPGLGEKKQMQGVGKKETKPIMRSNSSGPLARGEVIEEEIVDKEAIFQVAEKGEGGIGGPPSAPENRPGAIEVGAAAQASAESPGRGPLTCIHPNTECPTKRQRSQQSEPAEPELVRKKKLRNVASLMSEADIPAAAAASTELDGSCMDAEQQLPVPVALGPQEADTVDKRAPSQALISEQHVTRKPSPSLAASSSLKPSAPSKSEFLRSGARTIKPRPRRVSSPASWSSSSESSELGPSEVGMRAGRSPDNGGAKGLREGRGVHGPGYPSLRGERKRRGGPNPDRGVLGLPPLQGVRRSGRHPVSRGGVRGGRPRRSVKRVDYTERNDVWEERRMSESGKTEDEAAATAAAVARGVEESEAVAALQMLMSVAAEENPAKRGRRRAEDIVRSVPGKDMLDPPPIEVEGRGALVAAEPAGMQEPPPTFSLTLDLPQLEGLVALGRQLQLWEAGTWQSVLQLVRNQEDAAMRSGSCYAERLSALASGLEAVVKLGTKNEEAEMKMLEMQEEDKKEPPAPPPPITFTSGLMDKAGCGPQPGGPMRQGPEGGKIGDLVRQQLQQHGLLQRKLQDQLKAAEHSAAENQYAADVSVLKACPDLLANTAAPVHALTKLTAIQDSKLQYNMKAAAHVAAKSQSILDVSMCPICPKSLSKSAVTASGWSMLKPGTGYKHPEQMKAAAIATAEDLTGESTLDVSMLLNYKHASSPTAATSAPSMIRADTGPTATVPVSALHLLAVACSELQAAALSTQEHAALRSYSPPKYPSFTGPSEALEVLAQSSQPYSQGTPGVALEPSGHSFPQGTTGLVLEAPEVPSHPCPQGARGGVTEGPKFPSQACPQRTPEAHGQGPEVPSHPRPQGAPGEPDHGSKLPGYLGPQGALGPSDQDSKFPSQPRPQGASGVPAKDTAFAASLKRHSLLTRVKLAGTGGANAHRAKATGVLDSSVSEQMAPVDLPYQHGEVTHSEEKPNASHSGSIITSCLVSNAGHQCGGASVTETQIPKSLEQQSDMQDLQVGVVDVETVQHLEQALTVHNSEVVKQGDIHAMAARTLDTRGNNWGYGAAEQLKQALHVQDPAKGAQGDLKAPLAVDLMGGSDKACVASAPSRPAPPMQISAGAREGKIHVLDFEPSMALGHMGGGAQASVALELPEQVPHMEQGKDFERGDIRDSNRDPGAALDGTKGNCNVVSTLAADGGMPTALVNDHTSHCDIGIPKVPSTANLSTEQRSLDIKCSTSVPTDPAPIGAVLAGRKDSPPPKASSSAMTWAKIKSSLRVTSSDVVVVAKERAKEAAPAPVGAGSLSVEQSPTPTNSVEPCTQVQPES